MMHFYIRLPDYMATPMDAGILFGCAILIGISIIAGAVILRHAILTAEERLTAQIGSLPHKIANLRAPESR